MEDIILLGAGGHCKVIIDIIRSCNDYNIVGILDPYAIGSYLLDIPIIGNDEILTELRERGISNAFICIGALNDAYIRNKLFNKLKDFGFNLPVLIHRNSIVSKNSTFKEGSCVMAGAIVNADAIISENCIINSGSIIEHDCFIDRNTHISPGASLAGGVKVGYNSHIGIGSCVIQGVSIGNNVIVGAGAVVIEDIDDNSVAVGVPAKIIKRR